MPDGADGERRAATLPFIFPLIRLTLSRECGAEVAGAGFQDEGARTGAH